MRKTPLKRIGKVGRANMQANALLQGKLAHITLCEAGLPGCLGNMFPTKAHRHKRAWYKGDIGLLSDYKQVILICVKCHNTIEHNAELTKRTFQRLRGDE